MIDLSFYVREREERGERIEDEKQGKRKGKEPSAANIIRLRFDSILINFICSRSRFYYYSNYNN